MFLLNFNLQEMHNIIGEESTSKKEQATQATKRKNITRNYKSMQEGENNAKALVIIAANFNSYRPNISILETSEVEGGIDRGCQENHTNLQDGITKRGSLPHVLHVGVKTDLKIDLRASVNTKRQQQY